MKTKKQKLKFKKGLFSIDALDSLYTGYYIPCKPDEQLVNPIVPYFPLETCKTIAAQLSFDEWEIFYSEIAEALISIPRSYGVEFTEVSEPIAHAGQLIFDFSFGMDWEKFADLD